MQTDTSSTLSCPGTVYVVDDDTAVRDSLQFLLQTFGWPVRTYGSGAEVLSGDGLVSADHGWLVLDYHMPDMDGLELLARLRSRGVGLPAILMTDRLNSMVVQKALVAGIHAVVEKPLNDDELLYILQHGDGLSKPT